VDGADNPVRSLFFASFQLSATLPFHMKFIQSLLAAAAAFSLIGLTSCASCTTGSKCCSAGAAKKECCSADATKKACCAKAGGECKSCATKKN